MEQIQRPRYAVQVILPTYQVIGQAEPIGPWLDYLNVVDKHLLTLHDARVLPVGSAATAATRPEVSINRAEACLIILTERAAHASVFMHKHTELAITHLGPIICRGEYHMGVDVRLGIFFDSFVGDFYPVTNVDLHSAVAYPEPVPAKAELVLLNRRQVQFYYPAA